MLYVGIDQHRKQLTLSVRDESGDVLIRRQVSTEWTKVRAFFTELRDRAAGDGGFFQGHRQNVIRRRVILREVGADLRRIIRRQIHDVVAQRDARHPASVNGECLFIPAVLEPERCQDNQCHNDRRHRQDRVRPPGNNFFLGRLFGNDLLLQSGRRGDLPESGAQRLLPRTMLRQPAGQFRILLCQPERPGNLWIIGVRRAGPVEQQNGFYFVVIHKFGGWGCAPVVAPVSSWCSRPRPRVRRDLTVPSGTSRISAISL